MRPLRFFGIACLLICACNKRAALKSSQEQYLDKVKTYLQREMSPQDYSSLNFQAAQLATLAGTGVRYLNIPFFTPIAGSSLLIIKSNNAGDSVIGKVIEIKRDSSSSTRQTAGFQGSIQIRGLRNMILFDSKIKDGYVTVPKETNTTTTRTEVKMPDGLLPEVIIVTHVHSTTQPISSYLSMDFLFDEVNDDSPDHTYIPIEGGGGSSASNDNPDQPADSDDLSPVRDLPYLTIDNDNFWSKDAIDLASYFKCFNLIADEGATYSIEILTDIPVDNDPTVLLDYSSQSAGHTFIALKKSNGIKSIVQHIGFYPATGRKNVFTDAPLSSKIVDDGHHEYNASMTKNLSAEQFTMVLNKALECSRFQYDIDSFNCTDWALDIFNFTGEELEIPLFAIPGTFPAAACRTPQGLFLKLKEMKQANGPLSGQIDYDFIRAYVPNSHGGCN